MRSFLKYTLATITGIMLTTMVLVFLLIIIIASSSSDKPVEVKSNSILYMKLNARIVDRAVENPFDFIPTGLPSVSEMGLDQILSNIKKAKKDDNIDGIYLELSAIAAGMGTTEEIRNALLDFKESGKFIVAFGDQFTQKSYYLASVADSLFMNPEGYFFFNGMSYQMMFFKGALDKLGIEAPVIRHGDYTSFVEPYTNDRMSPENREQILTWMGSLWKHIIEGIAEQRGLETEVLIKLADDLSVSSTKQAYEYGMIDGPRNKDEIINLLKEKTGTPEKRNLKAVTMRKYTKVAAKRDYKGIAKDKIAVIYAHGDVLMGNSGEGTISSERISKAIRQARRDSSIKAIVLRVNSGGGGALAADIIWREADLASKTKPLIGSMGDVAASGGYFIVAPADTILAQPNTITGSIGVFAMLPNMKPFMNNKLGITFDGVKTNPYADIGSPFRPLTPNEKLIFQSMVEDTYNSFIEKVSLGRGMTKDEVDAIGGGRVWSGENALENGLIDGYGGMHEAIEVAASMAGLEKYRVLSLPKLEDPIELFIRELTENAKSRMLKRELGEFYQHYESLQDLQGHFGIQARMPLKFE